MALIETDLYRYDSAELARLFDDALARGDGVEISGIFRAASKLMREFMKTMDSKYGRPKSMSLDGRRHSWKGKTPSEVMSDLRNAREIMGDWIERAQLKIDAKNLSRPAQSLARRAVRDMKKRLRTRMRAGRKWVNRRWPGWWTPSVEGEFNDFL